MVVHGMNARVYLMHASFTDLGTTNLTGRSNDCSLTIDIPTADVTGYGSVAKSFVTGQYGWKFDMKGFADSVVGTTNPEGAFSTILTSPGTIGSITFQPEGSATGRPVWNGNVWLTSYGVTSNLGGGVSWTASFQGSGTVTRTTQA